ncbi:MAG TPA: ParA family protein [Albitalea sp.]|uniref:ParA family protein n=1 Tax=Piscinibacter sp. TaxID=1903157 RepID=UPI002ED07F9D
MPVIAVINRKGGSGKSTLATHLAAFCANNGIPVMLGDVDKQQSTQTWLKLRTAQGLPERAPIVGWAVDPRNVLRPPAGITRVVLDTPGGLRGTDLARVVMYADAILMPVCNSVFDRDSAADCHAELMTLPRVSSGRCKLAAIGMRLDARTKAADVLAAWAQRQHLPFIGVLRETQTYVKCVEQGLTLFDLPPTQAQADLLQWKPILEWLEPVLHPAQGAAEERIKRPVAAPRPMPVPTKPMPPRRPLDVPPPAPPSRGWLGWLGLPRFLQR